MNDAELHALQNSLRVRTCPVCGYSVTANADGAVRSHYVADARYPLVGRRCEGEGRRGE